MAAPSRCCLQLVEASCGCFLEHEMGVDSVFGLRCPLGLFVHQAVVPVGATAVGSADCVKTHVATLSAELAWSQWRPLSVHLRLLCELHHS